MNPQNQYCTPEQSKELAEFGVSDKAAARFTSCAGCEQHCDMRSDEFLVPVFNGMVTHDECFEKQLPAWSVAELGVMLGERANTVQTRYVPDNKTKRKPYGVFLNNYKTFPTEAQARAAALLWYLKEGILTAKEVNERLVNSR
ncbi:MAG: hypothetical protein LUE98_11855 [Tannerellaceae bacterium]|nr:hypothetical protein [Tannerellaceae bacterium]